VAVIKGDEKDPSTCMRCKVHYVSTSCILCIQGKTFEMERKLSKKSAWHPKCFCCSKCATAFQNIHYIYEGTDDEIYCKTCFKKAFPENETPKIFADTGKVPCEDEAMACPRCSGAVHAAEQMEIKVASVVPPTPTVPTGPALPQEVHDLPPVLPRHQVRSGRETHDATHDQH
jgi:hypothetical protein